MNKTLNRMGDTSFRLANQLKFYTQLLEEIYFGYSEIKHDNSFGKNRFHSEQLYEKIIEKGLINYKDNKLGSKERSNILIKNLRDCSLIEEVEDGFLSISDLGRNFIKILNEYSQKFILEKGIEINAIIWFYLYINKWKKSNIFKSFVKFILTYEEQKEIDIDILSSFVICDPHEPFIVKKINKNTLTNDELNKILNNESIQIIAKRRKPLKYNKELPQLIKNLNNNSIINTNLKIIDSKFMSELKVIYKINKGIKTKKKISDEELFNYIKERGILLIDDYLYKTDVQTVKKDYIDINKRWFIQMNLLKEENKKFFINKEYKEIYKKIIELDFDDSFNSIIKLIDCEDKILLNKEYPFDIQQVINILELIKEEKWCYLKKEFELENIANHTIFEYIVNISFYLAYKKPMDDFIKYNNTILDSKWKPISHATGGKWDGAIIDEENKLFCTIESTILKSNKDIYNNERTSIQTHAISFKKYLEKQKEINNILITPPATILVIKENINPELILEFIPEDKCYEFGNDKNIIKMILLDCEHLIKFLKLEKLKISIFYTYENLPLKVYMDINKKEWYKNEYDNIIKKFI